MEQNIRRHSYTKRVLITGMIVAVSLAATISSSSFQKVNALGSTNGTFRQGAPIGTAGDNNVYVVWWTNKTGNDEVMFKASTDNGKTFGDKMNLSNSTNSESQDVSIAASGNNVYVSWWERNQTTNEPVMRVSNDNGKTFGQEIMLSEK